jgi:hypothetical protein
MTRAADFLVMLRAAKASRGISKPEIMIDLTEAPIAAVGYGEWVRSFGKTGAIHLELSAGAARTATVHVWGSNSADDNTGVPLTVDSGISLTTAQRGGGFVLQAGWVWVRVQVSAISADTSVSATLAFA